MELVSTLISRVKTDKEQSATPGEEPNYYQTAKNWSQERYELIEVSRNRYRLLAAGFGGLLALSIAAIIAMQPLKQYVYRLVEVNRQTGEVTALKELEEHKYASNWVVTRYFLHQYITNRHLYSYEDIKRTFNLALAMSAKPIYDKFADLIIDTNPESPLNTLNTNYYRDVEVLGINQLNDNTALVRFRTITTNKSAKDDKKIKELQAVIKWEYANAPASLKERDDNPLGFFVTYYQESPVYAENN